MHSSDSLFQVSKKLHNCQAFVHELAGKGITPHKSCVIFNSNNNLKRPDYKTELFSLDRPLTKYKILDSECQLKFFFAFFKFQKIIDQAFFLPFWIEMTIKNHIWHLVFSIRFSVTSRSNEIDNLKPKFYDRSRLNSNYF